MNIIWCVLVHLALPRHLSRSGASSARRRVPPASERRVPKSFFFPLNHIQKHSFFHPPALTIWALGAFSFVRISQEINSTFCYQTQVLHLKLSTSLSCLLTLQFRSARRAIAGAPLLASNSSEMCATNFKFAYIIYNVFAQNADVPCDVSAPNANEEARNLYSHP